MPRPYNPLKKIPPVSLLRVKLDRAEKQARDLRILLEVAQKIEAETDKPKQASEVQHGTR